MRRKENIAPQINVSGYVAVQQVFHGRGSFELTMAIVSYLNTQHLHYFRALSVQLKQGTFNTKMG